MNIKTTSKIIIYTRNDHPRGANATREVKQMAKRFLEILELDQVELSIVITSDPLICLLNEEWRGKKEATDVLSFPACKDACQNSVRVLGDIVISLDTAQERACFDKKLVNQELARYLAHGLLHLLGHDHHEPQEAKQMASWEEKLLGEAGLVGKAM